MAEGVGAEDVRDAIDGERQRCWAPGPAGVHDDRVQWAIQRAQRGPHRVQVGQVHSNDREDGPAREALQVGGRRLPAVGVATRQIDLVEIAGKSELARHLLAEPNVGTGDQNCLGRRRSHAVISFRSRLDEAFAPPPPMAEPHP